jgi:chromosome partitioning protein
MRTIAVVNQKGGCGKTITAINLSACLAERSEKVLLVDLDPQGHASLGLNIAPEEAARSMYHVLSDDHWDVGLEDVCIGLSPHLTLAPSGLRLAAVEQELAGHPGREDHLLLALADMPTEYDYVVVDCPPNLGLLTFNALRACREIIIPVETSFFALHGLGKLSETVKLVEDRFGQKKYCHVLATIYDRRTRIANEVYGELSQHFPEGLFHTIIRTNVRLREAAGFGQPICRYDRHSRGYRDYAALAEEVREQAENRSYQTRPSPIVASYAGPHCTDNGVLFSLHAPDAEVVQVVGDFNDWQPDEGTRLDHNAPGRWSKLLPLEPGTYQYRFIVDGRWIEDPHNPNTIDSPYGVRNSIVEFPGREEKR